MKNNFIKMILIFMALLLVSQTGFCDTEAVADANPTHTELVVMMIKFGKVMFGVLIASVIIYAILYIWNLIVKRSEKRVATDLSLRTPQNIEDAILFFINKNKIK